MTDAAILTALKTDLDISVTSRDTYLGQLVTLAKAAIQKEGITLDDSSVEDGMLVEMYAAYLYRQRKGDTKYADGTRMPRMLRWALNNRLMSEKGAST